MEEQNLTAVEHKKSINQIHWVSNAWYIREKRKEKKTSAEINLVRSRITSKLDIVIMFTIRQCAAFVNRQNMTIIVYR